MRFFSLVVLLSNADYDAYYIAGDKKLRKHRGPLDSKYGVCARICMSLLARLTERYFRDDASLTLIFEAGAKNQGAAQTILGDMYRAAADIAKYLAPAVGYAIKEQSPIRTTRRLPGPHWSQLQGFPMGWTSRTLRSTDGFLLLPPELRPPLPVGCVRTRNSRAKALCAVAMSVMSCRSSSSFSSTLFAFVHLVASSPSISTLALLRSGYAIKRTLKCLAPFGAFVSSDLSGHLNESL
jgi:hypothetical protein